MKIAVIGSPLRSMTSPAMDSCLDYAHALPSMSWEISELLVALTNFGILWLAAKSLQPLPPPSQGPAW